MVLWTLYPVLLTIYLVLLTLCLILLTFYPVTICLVLLAICLVLLTLCPVLLTLCPVLLTLCSIFSYQQQVITACFCEHFQNSFLKFSINEFLLSNGLAKLEKNFTETDIGDVVVGKVWNNLRKAERKAKRRKLGLWTDDSCVGRLSYMTLVGGFLAWPFKKIKALWMINK